MTQDGVRFRISADGRQAQGEIRKTADELRRLGSVGPTLASLQPILTRVAAAVAGLGAVASAIGGRAISGFSAYQREMLTLEQVVRATGGSAQRTAADIDGIATAMERSTLATGTQVREAAAQLLTFRSVSGDTFDRTLKLAQDLAAVGFGSLSSASVQLGKALEDPVRGVSALAEVGVSFSAQQREQIRLFVETGRVAQAQGLILDVVAKQVGGAGGAQAEGLAGAFHRLSEASGGFFDTLGERIDQLIGLESGIKRVAASVEAFSEAIAEPTQTEQLRALVEALIRVEGMSERQRSRTTAYGGGRINALRDEIEGLRFMADASLRAQFVKAQAAAKATKDEAERLKTEMDDAALAAAGIAGADMAGNVSAAARAAGVLAERLGISLRTARMIANADGKTPEQRRLEARVSAGLVPPVALPGGGLPGAPTVLPRFEMPDNPSTDTGSGSGSGSGSVRDTFASLQAEGTGILSALDVALAGVREKVRAGLLSAGEGVTALGEARERAAMQIAELIPQLDAAADAAGPRAAAAAEVWRGKLDEIVRTMGRVDQTAQRLGATLADSFAGSFAEFITGAKSGEGAMRAFGQTVVNEIARIAAQRFTQGFVTPLVDSLIGGLFGGAGGIRLFAAGGVVNRPVLFRHAGGLGVMGEAGPEAIMPMTGGGVRAIAPGGRVGIAPLTRDSGGRLGVKAFARGGVIGQPGAFAGGGATAIPEIHIHNNGQPVTARAEMAQGGGMPRLDIFLDQIDSGLAARATSGRSALAAVFERNYGARRVPR